MRVAWFSPSCERASRFSNNVIKHLSDSWEMELFTENSYQRFFESEKQNPFDLSLYVFADSPSANFVKSAASWFPGVSVFLDATLNRLFYSELQYSSGPEAIDGHLRDYFGDNVLPLGAYHQRGWPIDAFDVLYATGAKEVDNSVVALFTNPNHTAHYKGAKSFVESIGWSVTTAAQNNRTKPRQTLNIADQKFLIGSFGELEPFDRSKQVAECLIAAGFGENLVSPSSFDCSIQEAAAICDVVIGMRTDPLRDVSPGVIEALSAGVPTIVNDTGANAEIPESISLKISTDGQWQEELVLAVKAIEESLELRQTMAETGRTYITDHHRPELIAERIVKVVSDKSDALDEARRTRLTQFTEAKNSLLAGLQSSSPDEIQAVANELWN